MKAIIGHRNAWIPVLLTGLLAACGAGSHNERPDAATTDAAATDAATTDSAVADLAMPDGAAPNDDASVGDDASASDDASAGDDASASDDASVSDDASLSNDAGTSVPDGSNDGIIDDEAPEIALLAPLRDFAETRRLLRGTVSDAHGLASVSYAVNDGAPVAVALSGQPTELTLAEALPLRAGENTLTVSAVDLAGNRRDESYSFRYGPVTAGGGSHSGVVDGGKLYTFGRNNVGQLGLGVADASKSSPTEVPTFGATDTGVVAAAFNQNESLALRSDGTVWTWGSNTNGELGLGDSGSTAGRNAPAQVPGVTDAVYATVGYNHMLILRADGSVWGWGQNSVGQVGVDGDGTSSDKQPSPVAVTGLPANVVEVVAGSAHSAALIADGSVYVWGRNGNGNLGIGSEDALRHPTPSRVPGLNDVVDLATGRDHLLAVKADGTVVAWGLGSSGQLGYGENTNPDGNERTSPTPVATDDEGATPLGGVAAVFANGNTSFALLRDGQLWGWGEDGNGTLGQGGAGGTGAQAHKAWSALRAAVYTLGTDDEPTVYLDELVKLRAVGVGALHVIARTDEGDLYSWGWNTQGTLGIPSFPATWRQPAPVLITLP